MLFRRLLWKLLLWHFDTLRVVEELTLHCLHLSFLCVFDYIQNSRCQTHHMLKIMKILGFFLEHNIKMDPCHKKFYTLNGFTSCVKKKKKQSLSITLYQEKQLRVQQLQTRWGLCQARSRWQLCWGLLEGQAAQNVPVLQEDVQQQVQLEAGKDEFIGRGLRDSPYPATR